jgi:hypothetical protein
MPAQYPRVPKGGCRILIHGVAKLDFKPTFRSRNLSVQTFTIAGITKDSTGAPLGGCVVDLFNTDTDVKINSIISDVNGNYSFPVQPGVQFYIVAYKPETPNIAGTSANTLIGT